MKNSISAAVEAATRAETPFILFAEDLSLRLRLPLEQARSAILANHFGPWMTIDGQPAVTRDSFVEHVKLRMAQETLGERELLKGPRPVPCSKSEGRRSGVGAEATSHDAD